jgi:hypothetical protein
MWSHQIVSAPGVDDPDWSDLSVNDREVSSNVPTGQGFPSPRSPKNRTSRVVVGDQCTSQVARVFRTTRNECRRSGAGRERPPLCRLEARRTARSMERYSTHRNAICTPRGDHTSASVTCSLQSEPEGPNRGGAIRDRARAAANDGRRCRSTGRTDFASSSEAAGCIDNAAVSTLVRGSKHAARKSASSSTRSIP